MTNLLPLIITIIFAPLTYAGAEKFHDGPLIKGYGKHAKVEHTHTFNKDTRFKIAFDVADPGDKKKVNRRFNTLARFLNMHVANGIPAKNIELALVVHGKAGFDLLSDKNYQEINKANNPNRDLLEILLKHNVSIYLCGQSAAYYGITNEQLIDGVSMSLSAMTTHALLAEQGYSLNPF